MKFLIRLYIIIGSVLVLQGTCIFGQVSVGSSVITPDPSAMLEVSSADKGFLPPRVALSETSSAAPVNSPAAGLLIYNTTSAGSSPTNVTPGYYYWNGNSWISIAYPQGTATGDMFYWNGTEWVIIPLGSPGQMLKLSQAYVPGWTGATITTAAVSAISSNTATSGGNITLDGGDAILIRGVCWSTSPGPTADLTTKTVNGAGLGVYTSNLTGLAPVTTYYLRAYSINSSGIWYGNEVSFTTSLSIGNDYLGGKVAYIFTSADPGYVPGEFHGLIAAASDQGTAQWGCFYYFLNAVGTAIGTGNQNTINIIAGCSDSGIAAKLCGDLVLNGYSDWYLPSCDELNKLYLSRTVIGGFSTNYYWSSSEIDSHNALTQSFNNGNFFATSRGIWYSVRAIRSF